MKRSSQVALLLAGVTAAGGAGYAMMAPDDCANQERAGLTAPDQNASRCSSSSSHGRSYYSHGSGSNFGSSDASSGHGSSSSSSQHGSFGGGTAWGGFGGTGHAVAAHAAGS